MGREDSQSKMAKRTKRSSRGTDQVDGKALVVVESPAKARTINRYLGGDFVVKASMGHVRDLPQRRFGVDVDHDFRPVYQILPSRKRLVDELKKAAAKASQVYLATDLDREGEAIAWHLAQALELPEDKARRVVFNEITASAIRAAFANPKGIDLDKVNAQQARRILDRIVGYELSPLLWQKIAKGLSAGRVQSVAVRLIVEREQQIRQFVPTEYWQLAAYLTVALEEVEALRDAWGRHLETRKERRTRKDDLSWLAGHRSLRAELVEFAGQPFKPGSLEEARQAVEALGWQIEQVKRQPHPDYADKGIEQVELVGRLDPARCPPFAVRSVQKKRTTTRPPAPFITATLQQAASTQLRFSASKTMRLAQALYEGMEIGEEGQVGLITYMRTDSTNLAAEAVSACRAFIDETYGAKYLPEKPNVYRARSSAQEAHEAIRPTDVTRTPASLKGKLPRDHWRLYDLVWRRFVACQMAPAEWDSTTVLIAAETERGTAVFKATGRRLVFDGFLKVTGVDAGNEQLLPEVSEGQPLGVLALEPVQQFTSPPPRYTEASLVRALESAGIGRPSTYATIIQTIQDRGYAEQRDRKFYATPLGQLVTAKLIEHFPKIMDVEFTSRMEDLLDKIEEAHLDWVAVLREFYEPFKQALEQAEREMAAVRSEPSPYTCDRCGKPMVYRWGKSGRFLACSGYPECKFSRNVDAEGKPIVATETDHVCEKCGKPMVLRQSRGSYFLGCSGYPECNHTVPCDEQGNPLRKVSPDAIRETCDECGAEMVVRWRGRRAFLGCSKYPKCRGTKPLPEGIYVEPPPKQVESAGVNCPECGQPMVIRRGRRGKFVACSGYPRCQKTFALDRLEELQKNSNAGSGASAPQEASAGGDGGDVRAEPNAVGTESALQEEPASAIASGQASAQSGSQAKTSLSRNGKLVVESLDGPVACPECGSAMKVRRGRWGPFLSCGSYPRCKGTARLKGKAIEQAEQMLPPPAPRSKAEPTDIDCPACGAKMVIRMGRRGRFLGCSKYPRCRETMELPPELAEEVRKRLEAESRSETA